MLRKLLEPSSTKLLQRLAHSVNPNHDMIEKIGICPSSLDILIHIMIHSIAWKYYDYIWNWRYNRMHSHALACVQAEPLSLQYTWIFRLEKDVVLCAIKINGEALRWASESLRDNEEIVLEAITNSPLSYRWASPRLLANYQIINKALRQDIRVFRYIPEESISHSIVADVVKRDGLMIRLCDMKFKNSTYIAELAVANCPEALRHISLRLRNDKHIVGISIKNSPLAVRWASPNLRNQSDIMADAVSKDGRVLWYAGPSPRDDINVVLLAIENCPRALRWASPSIREVLE